MSLLKLIFFTFMLASCNEKDEGYTEKVTHESVESLYHLGSLQLDKNEYKDVTNNYQIKTSYVGSQGQRIHFGAISDGGLELGLEVLFITKQKVHLEKDSSPTGKRLVLTCEFYQRGEHKVFKSNKDIKDIKFVLILKKSNSTDVSDFPKDLTKEEAQSVCDDVALDQENNGRPLICLLYTSPSPRD